MSVDPPLTDDERLVLNVLMAPGTRTLNATTKAISERGDLPLERVQSALRSLDRREPPLIRAEVDEGEGVGFWMTTYAAAEAMEETDSR